MKIPSFKYKGDKLNKATLLSRSPPPFPLNTEYMFQGQLDDILIIMFLKHSWASRVSLWNYFQYKRKCDSLQTWKTLFKLTMCLWSVTKWKSMCMVYEKDLALDIQYTWIQLALWVLFYESHRLFPQGNVSKDEHQDKGGFECEDVDCVASFSSCESNWHLSVNVYQWQSAAQISTFSTTFKIKIMKDQCTIG